MSHATLRRLEPETYLKKAEDDIRRIQLAVSLAEPPWDGYCGLVQVSEEDVPAEEPGASPYSRPEPPTPPASVASPSRLEVAGPEQETTESILRQIRGIAATPQEGRQARLHALARQALAAAARSSPSAALQLLELAQFACPASDGPLRQQIAEALRQAQQSAAASERRPEAAYAAEPAEAQNVSTERQASAAEPPRRAAAEPQSAAAAANRHFLAAKDLIKRGQLAEALQELAAARDKCPPDRAEARRQIERHTAAVRAALAKQDG